MAEFIILNDITDEIRTGYASDINQIPLQAGENETAYYVPPGVVAWPNLNPQPLRDVLWEQVKTLRDEHEYGGCNVTIDGITYPMQTDERSQNLIGRAVLLANTISSAFSEVWTMANDVEVPIDNAKMVTIGLALGAHVSAVRAHTRNLRAQLYDSNNDVPALLRLDIVSGWPS